MANINNLNTPNMPRIEARIRAVESGAPMNNGAVGRSGFEVYDGGTINVSSGNIIGAGAFSWQGSFSQSGTSIISGATTIAGPTGITGALTIQGSTDVTGPFTVTGPTKLNGVTDVGGAFTVAGPAKITGTFDVTGVTKLAGNTTVSGTLDVTGAMATKGTLSVEGVTTLKNDLNVDAGKKINLGSISLESGGASGGQINLVGGALSSSAAFGTLLVSNTLELGGTTSLTLSAPLIKFAGLTTVSATTFKPNLYINPSTGRIYIAT